MFGCWSQVRADLIVQSNAYTLDGGCAHLNKADDKSKVRDGVGGFRSGSELGCRVCKHTHTHTTTTTAATTTTTTTTWYDNSFRGVIEIGSQGISVMSKSKG